MPHTPTALPLVDEVQLWPVLTLLDQHCVPTQGLLENAHLPRERHPDPGHFVSARSLLRFLSLAAREAQLDTLGWCSAADSDLDQLGPWGPQISRCRTLRHAIEVFGNKYSQTVNFVELGLSIERGSAWFWRRRRLPAANPEAESQGEQFMLGAMVCVVRHFAGVDWSPSEIRMDSRSGDWLRFVPELSKAQVSFSHETMAIALPLRSLDLPMRGRRTGTPDLGSEELSEIRRDDFIGSLHTALEPIVSQTALSLELGAEIAGTSPRTLRRWLNHAGVTWREVVDRVRFEKSVELLRETARPIVEVAYGVGYSDPAHFTRAFQRWTQESPRDYRRRWIHEREVSDG